MSTVNTRNLTLVDYARREKSKGSTEADIIEILNKQNPILGDMVVKPANQGDMHLTTMRSKLPRGQWRQANKGIDPDKSETIQVTEGVGCLYTRSVVDVMVAKKNGNSEAFLRSEEIAFAEGLNQQMTEQLFYGDTVAEPASFNGLAARYAKVGGGVNGKNVLSMGGTGSTNTSIWLIGWGDDTIHGIFSPQGTAGGLTRVPLGVQLVNDKDGKQFRAYVTDFEWYLGLAVRDWRFAARIANIDVAEYQNIIDSGASTAASQKLVRVMLQAHKLMPNFNVAKFAWYMSKTPAGMLDIMASEKSNVNLTMGEFEGRDVTKFKGIPIRIVEGLSETEKKVA